MSKRFVDYDPVSGISTFTEYDSGTDSINLTYEYDDVSTNLDLCKALANDEDYTKKGIKNGWWHYAHIPNSIINKWLIEEGINVFDRNDQKKVHQKLNSPEYMYLRTSHKRHFATR